MSYTDLISTLTVQPTTYDLVSLDDVTDDLGITDNKNHRFLRRAITAASVFIENYCNNPFVVETITDTFFTKDRWQLRQRAHWQDAIQLSRWPVVMMKSVVLTSDDGTPSTLVQGTDYILNAKTGQIIRLDAQTGFPTRWTYTGLVVQYAAGWAQTASAEAQTVPANPGPYTVTVKNAKLFALDVGVTYADGTPFTSASPLTAAGQYSVASDGTYTFYSDDAGQDVLITYAFTDIPADVRDAVTRLVRKANEQRGRDSSLIEEDIPSTGRRRWWFSTDQTGNLPPDVEELIENYRVPVL